MLRVLRTVRTPHERLETVYISWKNNMTATTRLPVCSVTQLDIWPSIRENTRMLLVISSTKEMLNETSFIAQPRTPDRPQFHLVLAELGANLEDWLVQMSRHLPKTLWSTAPLIAIVTRTSAATVQQSTSTQQSPSSRLNKFCVAVQWYTRHVQQSRGIADIKVLRLPYIK